jgi:hypothetical protein
MSAGVAAALSGKMQDFQQHRFSVAPMMDWAESFLKSNS